MDPSLAERHIDTHVAGADLTYMDVGYDILEFVKSGMWDTTYSNIYLKVLNKQFDSYDFNISCKTLLLTHFSKKVNFSNFVGYDILERGYRCDVRQEKGPLYSNGVTGWGLYPYNFWIV